VVDGARCGPVRSHAPVSVDLRHFRSFVVIAEEGNIGRAAARLFITQPALTRQLQRLESELGVTLLTRGPRGVVLTDAGTELLGKARIALDAAEQAMTIGRPAEPTGRLAVGLSVAGHRDHWYALAAAFTERYPGVDVEARSALSELLQRQVLAGELDVAIVLEPSRRSGLRYERLREDPVYAWAHPDHPLAAHDEVTVEQVATHTVTLVGGAAGRASGFNAAVRRIFTDAGCVPEYREPPDLIPIIAPRKPESVSVSVDVGYAPDVRRLRLTGDHVMRYEAVRRDESTAPAVLAFVAFAVRHARGA
jgi:DNA-binding transcriptional LysR family regulator